MLTCNERGGIMEKTAQSGSDRVKAWRQRHVGTTFKIELHLKIDQEGWAIDALAKKWELSRAATVRRLIAEWVAGHKDELFT